MNFKIYQPNGTGKTTEVNIKVGEKWENQKTSNKLVNSLFEQVDNGDGIVQEDEFHLFNKLLSIADNLVKSSAKNNIVDSKELSTLIEKLKNKTLKMEDIKQKCIDKIDVNDYSLESLKKRYPESKYKVENNSFFGDITTIYDKKTDKKVLTVYTGRDGYNITQYDKNEKSINCKIYQKNGTIYFYYPNGNSGKRIYPALDYLNKDLHSKGKFNSEKFLAHIKMMKPGSMVSYASEYKEKYGKDLIEEIQNSSHIDVKTKTEAINFIRASYEKEFGYDKNCRNDNSQVINKFHKGDAYSVIVNNDILTIKNKKTGKTKTVNLNDFVKNLDMQGQASVKAQLVELPGEVLMDLFTEVDPFNKANSLDKIILKGVAAYYNSWTNKITLGVNEAYDISKNIVHELGHAVDYNGRILNTSYVEDNPEFKASFKKELDNFIKHGGKRYDKSDKSCMGNSYIRQDGGTKISNYATCNKMECFAECYDYLMTGSCNSADLLEDFFPETLKLAEKILQEIRNMPENVRN